MLYAFHEFQRMALRPMRMAGEQLTQMLDNPLNPFRDSPLTRQITSAMTVFELEHGVRRQEYRDPVQGAVLRRWLDTQVLPAFKDRTLPIDVFVALKCAPIHVPNRCKERDALIAATAMVRGMTVVTRDTSDFAPTGATLFNPWA